MPCSFKSSRCPVLSNPHDALFFQILTMLCSFKSSRCPVLSNPNDALFFQILTMPCSFKSRTQTTPGLSHLCCSLDHGYRRLNQQFDPSFNRELDAIPRL